MGMRKLILFLFYLLPCLAMAQTGVIKGRVYDKTSNKPLAFATVFIDGTSKAVTTDLDGKYTFTDLNPALYTLGATYVGYEPQYKYEVQVSSGRNATVDFAMQASSTNLETVEVVASPYSKSKESPVSMRNISAAEIYRNPGGNRDISKVIQSLPGVATTVSFRNDIIIRGGAPNENRFFLDGIEVPNINHFATQGSSGGPVGMLNVNLIREVDFYSGAFPVDRGNALSSVFNFKQVEGNDEKLHGTFMVGSSDMGITLDGPIGKKSTFILSARRSYLQFLFKALALPFLPTYNDFQFKNTINLNKKNKLMILGLGAIDDFELNKEVNDNVTDSNIYDRNNYILGNIPVNTQWNYSIGAKWQHFREHSFQTYVVSRNHLNNESVKYANNIEDPQNLILNYKSQEIENKFRFEHNYSRNGWKINAGAGYQFITYKNNTFNKLAIGDSVRAVSVASTLNMGKYALFGQVSRSFLDNRLSLSVGVRTDFSDYSAKLSNPLTQLSPRFSFSYSLTEKWSINGNIGRYYQLPPYTLLGLRNASGNLVNKQNGVAYIQCDHAVSGIEYNPTKYARITVESFYKQYNHYPFSLTDSISLANLGGNFGVIGNEATTSISKGRSYGLEVLIQQKLSSSIYGILAYTFVRSEFQDKNGTYIPSAWDNGHILSLTGGKKFKRNWELGIKFRLSGGAPYTPYNIQRTALKTVWDITRQGVPDWDQINSKRLPLFHQLDFRIDKKWYFKSWALNIYFDVQNVYNKQIYGQPYINVATDAKGDPVTNPNDPLRYKVYQIDNVSGTLLPSIGLMVDL